MLRSTKSLLTMRKLNKNGKTHRKTRDMRKKHKTIFTISVEKARLLGLLGLCAEEATGHFSIGIGRTVPTNLPIHVVQDGPRPVRRSSRDSLARSFRPAEASAVTSVAPPQQPPATVPQWISWWSATATSGAWRPCSVTRIG